MNCSNNLSGKALFTLLYFFVVSILSAQEKRGFSSAPYFQFHQQAISETYPNLGYYVYYQNALTINVNKYRATLKAGIVEQGLYADAVLNGVPLLQNYYGGEIEYSLVDWMGLYAQGQYVSGPFNQKKRVNGTTMNPLFAQSGIGSGVRGEFNSLQFDLGVHKYFDTQFKEFDADTRVKGKVSFGF
ncbi:hypothetical protein HX109_10285 [Galbibacter sp. BG1]|uniref:hypothetical protein n=1 Tax=Galbibacter sp. BG1 TaxID=1170699 RepID=UPI0015B79D91|nr:hypothetical protein [Galbibacter sp. BG1]QLE01923.1 hypothetical protein HX109_10285 [Galbibacter sp. BG1]